MGYRGSLAAGEDADTEYGGGESAEAACSGAWSRGAALAQLGQSQNTGWTAGARPTGVQRDVASGAAGGFIGHQPVTNMPKLFIIILTPVVTCRHCLPFSTYRIRVSAWRARAAHLQFCVYLDTSCSLAFCTRLATP